MLIGLAVVLIFGPLIWVVLNSEPTAEPTGPAPEPSVPPSTRPSAPPTATTGPDGGRTEFEPRGPSNAWLDSRYEGPVVEWETEHRLLGFSPDRAVVLLQDRTSPESHLMGVDARTGGELWRLDESVYCGSRAVLDGTAYCSVHTEDENFASDFTLVEVDIATGELDHSYSPEQFTSSIFYPYGLRDGVLFGGTRRPEGFAISAFTTDGTTLWEQVLPDAHSTSYCHLLGEYLACDWFDSIAVLDAQSGAVVQERYELGEDENFTVWVTDGYYFRETGNYDAEIIVYDFSGTPTETRTQLLEPRFPTQCEGVFYPVADHDHGRTAPTVDADGRIVTSQPTLDTEFASTGAEAAGRAGAVSSDGAVVLITQSSHAGIFDDKGGLLHEFEIASYPEIIDGIITSRNPDTSGTVIYYPAEG